MDGKNKEECDERGSASVAAVFFDLDDTLYDQALPFAYAVENVLGKLPGVSAGELYDASRRHSGEVFAAFAAGRHPSVEEYARRMQGTLKEFGVDASFEEACAAQKFYATKTAPAMRLSPTMRSVLDLCAKNGRVGLISNGRGAQQQDKIRVLGLGKWIPAENVFVSEPLGTAKPGAKIFQIACCRTGVAASEALYVGDAFATDVVGAQNAGMRSIWLNRRHRAMPEGAKPATWEVDSEEGLLALLEQIL